jgi:hypothetical protein
MIEVNNYLTSRPVGPCLKLFVLLASISSFGLFSGMAQGQVTPSDVDATAEAVTEPAADPNLAENVGGEADSLGLQRPVELGELPFTTTFLLNSRMVRTSNYLKSEQAALIDQSLVYELGGTVNLSVSEATLFGHQVNPGLSLTHMRFFNRKLADILDFETQIAAFALAVPINETLTITPGLDYNRLISPGGNEHKFHGTGASFNIVKMIPHGDKGMFIVVGGGKFNWTSGDAILNPDGSYTIPTEDVLFPGLPVRTEDEQDRWDATFNLSYMYNMDGGIIISPTVGVMSSNYVINRNDGRHDYTYSAGVTVSKTFFEALNVGIFGNYSWKDTNDVGRLNLTQEYENFDYGLMLGYSKSF